MGLSVRLWTNLGPFSHPASLVCFCLATFSLKILDFENVDFACRPRWFSLSGPNGLVGKIRHQGFFGNRHKPLTEWAHLLRRKEVRLYVSRNHPPAARQRRTLRTPDQTLEPEDEKIHPHRSLRHLHHRLTAVACDD